MLGTDLPIQFSLDPERGLTIEVPQSVRENPPCKYAWAFAVADANLGAGGQP